MSSRVRIAAAVAAVIVMSLALAAGLHLWNKITEPDVTVTWSVDYSGTTEHTAKLPPRTARDVTAKIEDVLESDKGWQRHNLLGFRYINDPDDAEIVFRPTKLYETHLRCNNTIGAMGCGGGNRPFNGPHSCQIFFSQGLLDPGMGNVRVGLINHELGHCFLGEAHTASGLMTASIDQPTAETMYPSTEEIVRGVRNIRPVP